MAISCINSAKLASLNTASTTGISTLGATILIVHISRYTGGGSGTPTLSDSKSNTWNALTEKIQGATASRLYYATPADASYTDASHTVTVTGSVLADATQFAAFTAVTTSSPFDQQNGAAATIAFVQKPGSITTVAGALVVTGMSCESALQSTPPTIDNSFNLLQWDDYGSGNNAAGALAWKESSGAIDPEWGGFGNGVATASTIASFAPGAAASDVSARILRPTAFGIRRFGGS